MYEDLTVIICCAGTGKRLGIDFPKALLDLNGKPLILNLLDALREVKDVRIVVGFKYKNLINTVTKYRKDVTFCFNRSYASTGPAYSLEQAFVGVNKRVLIIDGDVVVDPSVLRKSLNLIDAQAFRLKANLYSAPKVSAPTNFCAKNLPSLN